MKKLTSRIPSKIRAFTLIEMLVVIAIIALLAGIITTSLSGSRGKARDAKRVSDLSNLQLSITPFFDRCNKYPLTLAITEYCTAVSGDPITLADYISTIPLPPANPAMSSSPSSYDYLPNNATAPTDFILHTKLEQPSDSIRDSLTNSFLNTYYAANGLPEPIWDCYDSSHPLDYCLGSR